jgi:eukaryotic-like serine/threonine-protein kinase
LAFPGYRLLRELGRGGMGVVYQAARQSDGALVAIKTIHPQVRPSESAIARFLREAETIRRLRHPHIVTGLDQAETQGVLWLAMEFIDGRDGYRIVEQEGALAIPRAINWMGQLLEALDYAHQQGFVHRDVKPANVLISATASGEKLTLTDFGLARAYQVSRLSGLTLAGSSGGTPKFMPPEQVLDMRSVKPAGDQYSAAATLYHFLTGKYLFEAPRTPSEWFLQILESTPTPIQQHRPDIADSLAQVIHQALSRKPEDRFPNVQGFAQALKGTVSSS